MVNLYKLQQEIIVAKQNYRLVFTDSHYKRDAGMSEENILVMEENYTHLCKLHNDYDPNDIAFNW